MTQRDKLRHDHVPTSHYAIQHRRGSAAAKSPHVTADHIFFDLFSIRDHRDKPAHTAEKAPFALHGLSFAGEQQKGHKRR